MVSIDARSARDTAVATAARARTLDEAIARGGYVQCARRAGPDQCRGRAVPRVKTGVDGGPPRPWDPAVPVCDTCRRPVAFAFVVLGLAAWGTELVHRADGPALVTVLKHSYPCIGKPTRLRELLAVLVSIANAHDGV